MNGKLSEKMMEVLNDAVYSPDALYSRDKTVQALVKRGMLVQQSIPGYRNFYAPSDLALKMLGARREYVNLNYCRYWMKEGAQIRHNVMQIEKPSYYNREYHLVYEYYKRSFEDEINAVAEWMQKAIELARAEIRAGVAS